MADIPRADSIRGTTMRWAWSDGPTRGKVYEHTFHDDGTVEWREVGGAGLPPGAEPERPPYAAYEVNSNVSVVSYLAPSGFTLTVVIDFETRELFGFASGHGQWHPVRGRLETAPRE